MIAHRLLALATFSLVLTGCATNSRLRAVGQDHAVACALTRFPTDTRIASSSIDTVAGVYRMGSATLSVRREGYRFLVDIPGSGVRETRMVSEWRFEDGCGAVYQFSMPLNGVGSNLTIIGADGGVSEWRANSA